MAKARDHDEYIAQAREFARPILERLRAAVHEGCPEAVETMKWSAPHFDYLGILAGMAAFKAHVRFGFWRPLDLEDPEGLFEPVGTTGMRAMCIEKLADLPSQRDLVRFVKAAARANEAAAAERRARPKKATRRKAPQPRREIVVPEDLAAGLRRNAKARKTFEGFSYTNRREYVEWIEGARRDETRAKRVSTALEWLRDGKPRNWKYM